MARLRLTRTPAVTPPPHEAPASLVASAARINLEGQAWRTYRFGNDEWQTEAWRLYDIIGEMRFAANWVGSACSRVRIYVAEVDKNGRIQQETNDPKVAAISDTLLGGPSAKAEALRLAGINLTVAGDFYIIGRGGKDDDDPDKWFIVSCSELRRWQGNIAYIYPNGEREYLDSARDLVIRVWTPHPRRSIWADSPTRAALPMLWEIERLTRYVFAQIDSRLVSAGLLPVPQGVSFPDDDDPELNLTGAEGLTQRLLRTGSASLKGEGTAAGVVPTIAEFPMEALGKIELVQFSSELSKQALDLRQEAVRRFALAMDMAPEILLGTGDANHWSAWHVGAENVKVHIEPLMTRICDALTTAYLAPALKALKKDPARYTFAYDTAPLVVRPQRLQDTLNLYEKNIVGAEAVLEAGDYKLSDAPDTKEDLKRFTRELILRDPNLMQVPRIREIAGYTLEVLPPDQFVTPQNTGAGPAPPPAPPTGIQETAPPPLPVGSTAGNALGGPGQNASTPPAARVAAASVPSPVTTFVVANAAVLRALELAGKRLLAPTTRGQFPETPPYLLHTKIKVTDVPHAQRLLTGAWDHLNVLTENLAMSVDTGALKNVLEGYCTIVLAGGLEHDANMLGEALRSRGFLDAGP
mgnify:CR=1 FL=1